VELFEVIRRGYAAGETIQGLSKKHGVHRRMVRQAVGTLFLLNEKRWYEKRPDWSGHGADRADAGL